MRQRLPSYLLLALALAGCQADREGPATLQSSSAATGNASASDARITMRYQCDGDNRVDVLGDDAARVTLADGRVVDLARTAGTAPPAFAGEALAFAIGSHGATLRQDEGSQWDCRAS